MARTSTKAKAEGSKTAEQGSAGASNDARAKGTGGSAIKAARSVTINREPEEIYAYWRQLDNLPRFMHQLRSVTVQDDRRSHWVVEAPAGSEVEWDAEITEDRPGEVLAWQTLPGSQVPNQGEVRFEKLPGDRGTLVRASLEYSPPAGVLGKLVAKLFGKEPNQQMHDALLRLRQIMEVGYVTTVQGQPTGEARNKAKGKKEKS